MGAHRLDRTGSRGAGLVALALLAACTGGDGPAPTPTAAPPPTSAAPTSAPPATEGPVREREVARVKGTIERMPPGVTVRGAGPRCVQYERTGGDYGKSRYQVKVVLRDAGGPAFQGPKGTAVHYEVRVEAGGQAFDGFVSFQEPYTNDGGFTVIDPDDLTAHGEAVFRPEHFWGIQEVPAGMTACVFDLQRPEDTGFDQVGGYPIRFEGDGDPVVRDVEGGTRPLDEA